MSKEKVTFVFEFEKGRVPAIGKDTQFAGGRCCAFSYYDALEEIDRLEGALERVRAKTKNNWDEVNEVVAGALDEALAR